MFNQLKPIFVNNIDNNYNNYNNYNCIDRSELN